MMALTSKWWVLLIQGLLMIVISIIIFNNPGDVLLAISLWLGLIILAAGLIGLAAFFIQTKEHRENSALFWSLAVIIIGLLMITRIAFTMKAITVLFGLIIAAIGLKLITDSWSVKKIWSKWWLLAILGVLVLLVGIDSIFYITSGAETISTLIGIYVLVSGISMLALAYLKKKLLTPIQNEDLL